ncbi:MAG TPA: DUF2829 domain-containing protein [Mesotoga sp.]|nr:DUF2829 domain-containing protein [Mesotoga sp.]
MDFQNALTNLKVGNKVARNGWNGKDMYLYLVRGGKFNVNREPLLTHLGYGTEATYRDHIDMKTADGSLVPWVASQTDLLADDWKVVL